MDPSGCGRVAAHQRAPYATCPFCPSVGANPAQADHKCARSAPVESRSNTRSCSRNHPPLTAGAEHHEDPCADHSQPRIGAHVPRRPPTGHRLSASDPAPGLDQHAHTAGTRSSHRNLHASRRAAQRTRRRFHRHLSARRRTRSPPWPTRCSSTSGRSSGGPVSCRPASWTVMGCSPDRC